MSWTSLIGWIVLPQIGGILGGLATVTQIKSWYEKLIKPSWRPPNAVFGPAWTLLYLFMGIASYLVDRDGEGTARGVALAFYLLQLLLNWTWTPVFFVLHQLGVSIVIILALFVNIFICILQFWQINTYAGMLMIPYLAWVGFASALNISIWQLNSPYAQPPPRRRRPVPDLNQL